MMTQKHALLLLPKQSIGKLYNVEIHTACQACRTPVIGRKNINETNVIVD